MRALVKKQIIRLAAAAAFVAVPGAAQAQIFYSQPNFERAPMEAADPLVGVPLPGANQAEQRAALIWNMRAGLNVAALRCQFMKYLRAVDNYNALIDHHADELAGAYSTLESYFRRVHGARLGPRKFDEWSTLTYNNFSTIAGQMSFCQAATNISKEALARRKGEFLALARERMRELRGSLQPFRDPLYPAMLPLRPLPATAFGPVCTGLTGPQLQQCLQRR